MTGFSRAGLTVMALLALAAPVIEATNCSSSQAADVKSAVAEFADELMAECISGECSSGCVSLMTAMVDQLPDCEYADGVNYYAATAASISLCESGSSDITGLSASASDSGSTAPDCSATESVDTADYLEWWDADLCDADVCASDCLDVLLWLRTMLPDCIDTDGDNHYQIVLDLVAKCTGSSGSSDVGSVSESASGSAGVVRDSDSEGKESGPDSASQESEPDSAGESSSDMQNSTKTSSASVSEDSDAGSNSAAELTTLYAVGAAVLVVVASLV